MSIDARRTPHARRDAIAALVSLHGIQTRAALGDLDRMYSALIHVLTKLSDAGGSASEHVGALRDLLGQELQLHDFVSQRLHHVVAGLEHASLLLEQKEARTPTWPELVATMRSIYSTDDEHRVLEEFLGGSSSPDRVESASGRVELF